MDRRELLGVLGTTAAGLVAVTGGARAEEPGHKDDPRHKCAEACADCMHECEATADCCDDCIAECEKLDDPEMKEVVASLRRCAQSCREMVKMMGGPERRRSGGSR